MIKTIKKIFIILSTVIVLAIVLLTSVACVHFERKGLDNFHIGHSPYGLTQYLIPKGFLEAYYYVDGNYYYYYV